MKQPYDAVEIQVVLGLALLLVMWSVLVTFWRRRR
jgi:hypothetical protein